MPLQIFCIGGSDNWFFFPIGFKKRPYTWYSNFSYKLKMCQGDV